MARTNNVLKLPDNIKVVEWLRENWEKRVQANRMTAQDIADAVSQEKGIEKVTQGNIYGVLDAVFPQWKLPRIPKHLNVDARDFDARITKLEQQNDFLASKLEALMSEIDHLKKEFGVKPMTSFLCANSHQQKK